MYIYMGCGQRLRGEKMSVDRIKNVFVTMLRQKIAIQLTCPNCHSWYYTNLADLFAKHSICPTCGTTAVLDNYRIFDVSVTKEIENVFESIKKRFPDIDPEDKIDIVNIVQAGDQIVSVFAARFQPIVLHLDLQKHQETP